MTRVIASHTSAISCGFNQTASRTASTRTSNDGRCARRALAASRSSIVSISVAYIEPMSTPYIVAAVVDDLLERGFVVLVDEALHGDALVERLEQALARRGREQLDADRLAHRGAHRHVLADREHAIVVVGGDLDLFEADAADRANRETIGAAIDELLDHVEIEHDVAVEQDEAVVLDMRARQQQRVRVVRGAEVVIRSRT